MRTAAGAVFLAIVTCALAPAPATITLAARFLQPGELVVATIDTTVDASALQVHAFGREFTPYRVDGHIWRVLVGIDLDVAPGTYSIAVDGTAAGLPLHATHSLLVRAKAFPTRTLTVNDAFVNPPAEMQARIEREAHELEQLWSHATPDRLWTGPFVRPVSDPANSAFGSRSVFNGQPRSPHSGADFLSAAGVPVKAPNAGRVVLARDLYYSGNTVIIDHGLGLLSLLCHFSAIDVHEGDRVEAGTIVGRVGATGRVTGPHLHWAVRDAGTRIDPLSLLAMLGK